MEKLADAKLHPIFNVLFTEARNPSILQKYLHWCCEKSYFLRIEPSFMRTPKIFFPQEFYEQHLSTVNQVHFTNREIDVIACLLSARGTGKIAVFLSIDKRTIETHIRNITSKLGCNTREGIIDFIEKSNKIHFFRNYYSLLQNEILFKKSLKEISKLGRGNGPRCILIQIKNKDPFTLQLKSHLELAGIAASIVGREKKADYTLFLFHQMLENGMPSAFLSKIRKSRNKVLLLLREGKTSKELPPELSKKEFIEFSKQENYFYDFFLLLKKLLPNLNLENAIKEFKENYRKIGSNDTLFNVFLTEKPIEKPSIGHNWRYLLSAFFLLTIMGSGALVFNWNQKNDKKTVVRSDVDIPAESALLNRPELMDQIDKAFKKQDNGIQTVALMGIGGAGKTTLARKYAHQQKEIVVWEINAETKASLMESLENLANALSRTEEDRKILRELTDIKKSSEREKKIAEFVKNHLKLHSNWFLIYDNVEKFADIQKYFPQDSDGWGQGKIILTTRNYNIQNNNFITQVIQIGELNENQKISLFTSIMNHGESWKLTPTKKKEIIEFLKKIPPFPLDVSVAAYYLKVTKIPYKKYLENLENYHHDFAIVQENLLKEAGSYVKTRYGIITSSLEHLIKNHKDLLLFISLLNSQNIPIDLLNTYKNGVVVDNFIFHLKKYSLITNDLSASSSGSNFSIHRSTQDITFSYLSRLLNLNKDSQFIKEIIYALDDYVDQVIEQEDFSKMNLIAQHLESVLNHPKLLRDFPKGLLESKLGCIYYFINNDKFNDFIENSLKSLTDQNLSSENSLRMARSLLHIGAVYTELRRDVEAQALFEKVINTYGEKGLKNDSELSWALSHLGNVHRRLKDYEKACKHLEESISLHKQYGMNNKRLARTLAYLGSVYRWLGLYQKSIDVFEESLDLYKKNYSSEYFRIGWILMQLGNVYRGLGDFQKAKQHFESGLFIFQKHLPENHVDMGLALAYLGNYYRELGDYEKSRDYLEQSLKIYQKYFHKEHVRMGWILFHLANTYKARGKTQEAQKLFDKVLEIYAKNCNRENIETAHLLRDMAEICIEKNRLDDAKNFINRSLRILQDHHHIEAFKSLEVLGEIYLKKSFHAKDAQESQDLKNQAKDKFNQALKITEQNFLKGSIHIQKIHSKIKKLKEEKRNF